MKRADLVGFVFCLALSAAPVHSQAGVDVGPLEPAPAGQPILLRVMTYNLHHGTSPDGQPTLPEIARFLRDNRLDFVGLQEVDRNWSARSEFRDQAAELAAATGLYLSFFPTLARGTEASYGLAILSRFPAARQVSGLYREAREPRGYLAIETSIAGSPVSFLVTHLGLDVTERVKQANELTTATGSLPGPLILAGDLNGHPGDPAVALLSSILRDALATVGRGAEGTLVTADGAPGARIDFLFATPEFRVEDCLVPEMDYSDHRPVVAFLSLYLEAPAMGARAD